MIAEIYKQDLVDRLEYLDSGKDTSYEVWMNPATEQDIFNRYFNKERL